jgi:hypothetical protein
MGNSPLEKDGEEERAKRGFAEFAWYLLTHPKVVRSFILALGGVAAWGWLRPTVPAPEEQYWDKAEFRQIVRAEVAPLSAGIEELAKSQSYRVQRDVLAAMRKAEMANRDEP